VLASGLPTVTSGPPFSHVSPFSGSQIWFRPWIGRFSWRCWVDCTRCTLQDKEPTGTEKHRRYL